MGILLAALIYAIMFAISLAIVIVIMPFEGALIRLRANYLPKAVIALRPCDDPESPEEQDLAFGAPAVERYTGIVDCLMKMRNEEGLESLMRGAWVTLLSVLLGNFA